jgi:hypothetical protein
MEDGGDQCQWFHAHVNVVSPWYTAWLGWRDMRFAIFHDFIFHTHKKVFCTVKLNDNIWSMFHDNTTAQLDATGVDIDELAKTPVLELMVVTLECHHDQHGRPPP